MTRKKHFKNIGNRNKVNLKRINKQKLINCRKCPKQFWKNIKGNASRRNVTDKIAPNEWFEYLKQLLCPQNYDKNGNENLLAEIKQNNDASELNALIREDEVRQGKVKLHSNKSPGPDGLPAECFKCTIENILPYFTTIFNNIFESGNIPDPLCSIIICPLLKKDSMFDPNNFRGVLLINTICKFLQIFLFSD